MSLIFPPSENDEKLVACQKSSFNLNRLPGSKKAVSLTSYFCLTMFSVQSEESYSEDLTLQVAAGTVKNKPETKFLI